MPRCSAWWKAGAIRWWAKASAQQRFDWGKRDTFVIPSWVPHSHHAPDADAVLFSFSDRPVQKALGLWRESRGNR